MVTLKLRKIGNSVGAILPQEVLTQMHLGEGDALYLSEAPGGGYRLTPYDPDFEEQMTIARRLMKENRDVLRELAK